MTTRATLALDWLFSNITPEFVAAARDRVGVALLDQMDAAAAEALALAEQGLDDARRAWVPHAEVPGWLRLGLTDTLRSWIDGTGRTCVHNPVPSHPSPVVAAAWKPGLVCCAPCAAHLLRLAGDADKTCDLCGRVVAGLDEGDGIHPNRVTFGALVYLYGACGDCTEAPGGAR